MPIVDPGCCWGGANEGLPIPGLVALSAGNDELSELSVLSGVIARLCGFGAERFVFDIGGVDTGGEDQEKVAAGEELFVDLARLTDGREGKTVEEEADAGAFAQGSPPSMSGFSEVPGPPRTSASKSASPAFPLLASNPLLTLGPPKLMNSLRVVAVALFAPSSCNLRVCSFSTRADMVLIRAM